MKIKRATVDDVDTLADCWVALAADQQQHGSRLRSEANRRPVTDSIARHVVMNEVLIALDPEPVGFVMYHLQEGTYSQRERVGVIMNLYVDPDARNQSIGSQLLAAAEVDLEKKGAETLSLDVLVDNDDARRFYRRHGYEPHRVELAKSIENDTHSKGDE